MNENDDQLDYIDQVIDRAKKLVQTRIWEEISESRLEAWLGCLSNYHADLLGAYLLDNLCYRSRRQFFSLLDAIFLDLPAYPSAPERGGQLVDRVAQRIHGSERSVLRIAPVIGLGSPPTKSGPYILRLAQRRYGINSGWLTWPYLLNDLPSIADLVFVDDFCGTGKQFVEFAETLGLTALRAKHPDMNVTYLVATVHQSGLDKIHDALPFVRVHYAERLGCTHTVLDDACFARYQIDGFREQVIAQYTHVTTACGLPTRGKFAGGFGDLGLAYAYAHATPNNTLPIFWYSTSEWTPLLER